MVLTTVTSQANDFPSYQGINVSPSGRLPSCLTNPEGSSVAGIPAEPIYLVVLLVIKVNLTA